MTEPPQVLTHPIASVRLMVRHESPPARSGIDGLMAEALGRDGVFTTDDAYRWRVSPAGLTRAIRKGRIARLLPRVYVVAGAPMTWWTRARAAAAWSSGALSHLSAGFAHRLIEDPPDEIDVVTAEARKVPEGIDLRCHASALVGPPHVVTVRGIPVIGPARTLLDIAPLVPEDVLEAGLEEALRRGVLNMPRLEWQLRTEGGKGRPDGFCRKCLSLGESHFRMNSGQAPAYDGADSAGGDRRENDTASLETDGGTFR